MIYESFLRNSGQEGPPYIRSGVSGLAALSLSLSLSHPSGRVAFPRQLMIRLFFLPELMLATQHLNLLLSPRKV